VWSSLWPSRPHDQVQPDQSKLGHLRKRLNHLLGADLRFSYGQ
jgi:hypothetical protein